MMRRTPMPRSKTPMKSKPKRRAKIDGIDYLALCRGQRCYLHLPSTYACDMETVVPCHSNQSRHGKGMGLKASDKFTVPGCHECHRELDQGSSMTRDHKFSVWDAAYAEWEIDREQLLTGE